MRKGSLEIREVYKWKNLHQGRERNGWEYSVGIRTSKNPRGRLNYRNTHKEIQP